MILESRYNLHGHTYTCLASKIVVGLIELLQHSVDIIHCPFFLTVHYPMSSSLSLVVMHQPARKRTAECFLLTQQPLYPTIH